MTNIYEDVETSQLTRMAETITDSLRTGHSDGAADFVHELAQRLADCNMVQALADEGIGQRAPIALLLQGREIKTPKGLQHHTKTAAELTLNGYIVVQHVEPPGLDEDDTESMRLLLHQKIEMADVVNIENSDGIDEALLPFIDHAETHGKPVQYTNPDA